MMMMNMIIITIIIIRWILYGRGRGGSAQVAGSAAWPHALLLTGLPRLGAVLGCLLQAARGMKEVEEEGVRKGMRHLLFLCLLFCRRGYETSMVCGCTPDNYSSRAWLGSAVVRMILMRRTMLQDYSRVWCGAIVQLLWKTTVSAILRKTSAKSCAEQITKSWLAKFPYAPGRLGLRGAEN